MTGLEGVAGTVVRAQVWTEGAGFELVERPLDEVARDISGRPMAVATIDRALVCGSDRHTVSGKRSGAGPSVLGHEAVGRVLTGGDGLVAVDGSPLTPGDRVVWSVTASCGHCDRCERGLTAKCRRVLKTGHEPTTGSWPLSGGYATHIALHPGLALVRVPAHVSDDKAAMSACALGTVMACMEVVGDVRGRRVVVLGVGMLGVCAVAVAVARGAAEVIAVDVAGERRALALRLGAAQAFSPDEFANADHGAAVVDVAIELSGAASSVQTALDITGIGGIVVLAGSVTPLPRIELDAESVTRSWTTIRGVHNYEPRHLAQAIDFVATEKFPIDHLFAAPVPLEQLPSLFTAPLPHGILRATCTPA